MAHWSHPPEREDGDTHDETADAVFDARRWLRGVAARSQSPLMGMLSELEYQAERSGLFIEPDYDEDRDDVDEMGPY